MNDQPLHPVLLRQLKKLGLGAESPPQAGWDLLLQRVSAAYTQADQDRYIVERAMAISSEELREASLRAQAASRAKSEFLANMSHEIRTPMNAILGFAELLQDGGQSDALRAEHVRTIRRNGEHLLCIVNDILDLSKIEAGKMTVESALCPLCQMVAEITATMGVRAAGKGLTLDFEYLFPVPQTIRSDALRVRQILMNLVGNAIKFTECGGIHIRVRGIDLAGPGSSVSVEVSDTGIGITPDQLANLFNAFHQADTSTTRRFGGTGLGLTISRRLAEILGGSLTVFSAWGRGSIFTLTLPTGSLRDVPILSAAPQAEHVLSSLPHSPALPITLPPSRILLVEDGPDNQRLISFHLSKAGAEVDVASNGLAALAQHEAASLAHRPYSLILMDMQMPVMDGYEATRRLRERGDTTPVIALTAHAMSSDRDRCLVAGCNDFATKPIDRAELLALCARWIGPARASAA